MNEVHFYNGFRRHSADEAESPPQSRTLRRKGKEGALH